MYTFDQPCTIDNTFIILLEIRIDLKHDAKIVASININNEILLEN